MTREVLQLALDALLDILLERRNPMQEEAITAIKEVLAQPEQEPVVFYYCKNCKYPYETAQPTSCDCINRSYFERVEYYAAPPKRQPLRGEQIYDIFLRELPKLTLGMAYVPEWAIPIARAIEQAHDIGEKRMKNPVRTQHDPRPLFSAAPTQREWVGLTDEDIHNTGGYEETREMYRFAVAIEAKLKEKNDWN